jgi:hypothetical protein
MSIVFPGTEYLDAKEFCMVASESVSLGENSKTRAFIAISPGTTLTESLGSERTVVYTGTEPGAVAAVDAGQRLKTAISALTPSSINYSNINETTTMAPGVYSASSFLFVSGTIILTGNPGDQYFFIAERSIAFVPSTVIDKGSINEWDIFWVSKDSILEQTSSTLCGIMIADVEIKFGLTTAVGNPPTTISGTCFAPNIRIGQGTEINIPQNYPGPPITFPGTSYTNIADYCVFGFNIVSAGGADTVIFGNVGSTNSNVQGVGVGQGRCTGRIDNATSKVTTANAELPYLFNKINNLTGTPLTSGVLDPSYSPGIYKADGIIGDGTITLTGSATDQFFFISTDTSIIFGENNPVEIILVGDVLPQNVFWIADSITIFGGSALQGILIASERIIFYGGSTITGALYSLGYEGVSLSSTIINGLFFTNYVNFPGTAFTNLRQYAVLANNRIANPLNSVAQIIGNIGVYNETSGNIEGFGPGGGTCTGTKDTATPRAISAGSELQLLYDTFQLFRKPFSLLNPVITGAYTPGTYIVEEMKVEATITLTGSATDQFFFISPTTIFFGESERVRTLLAGGVLPQNVFWISMSRGNFYSGTEMSGIVISGEAIDFYSGGDVLGGVYALDEITLPNAIITSFNQDPAPCFNKGTQILTQDGYKSVESLKVGDMIQTFGDIDKTHVTLRDSTFQKCVFIKKTIVTFPTQLTALICFKAGSLGDNLPEQDLYVSPNHGMVVGDGVIAAKYLVTGTKIFQNLKKQGIQYYHIELESHSCVKANGALTESFLR